jgi:RimJ/RimL family protein N-acetyltransferase
VEESAGALDLALALPLHFKLTYGYESVILRTPRLTLRPWQPEDFEPYAAMNADPLVRQFFPSVLTREESDAEIANFQSRFAREGFGMRAADYTGPSLPAPDFASDSSSSSARREFAGILGLQTMPYAVPGLPQPAVEIGWRLPQKFWRLGLATEGATAVIDYAFNHLRLPSVVAVTTVTNTPSRRVMERLGMTYLPALDFDHPRIAPDHPFRRHVLYQLLAPHN